MNEKIGERFIEYYRGRDYWELIKKLELNELDRLEENKWEFEALASGLKAKYEELRYNFKTYAKFKRKWVVTSTDCVSLIQVIVTKGSLKVLVYSRSLNVNNKKKSDLAWIKWVMIEMITLLYYKRPTVPRTVSLDWVIGSYHNYSKEDK